MASVSTVTQAGSSTSSTTTNSTSKTVMGKDDFMKMLIAQLKNQDPLNPMDGKDFAAQLAQFSTVEQLMNMSTSLSGMSTSISGMNNAQMATLIGNEVIAQGNSITVNGAVSSLSYNLSGAIQKGTVKIYDSSGTLVKTLNLGNQNAGVNTLTWDSSDLESGNYTFDVSAMDKSGIAVPVTTTITGTISGVSYKDGTPYITVNGQDIAFSSVTSIKKPVTNS
jgi:flagellar basal-body rod modification protein FlgD